MDHDALRWRPCEQSKATFESFEDGGRVGYAFAFPRDDDALTLPLPASFSGSLLIVKCRFIALSSMLGSVKVIVSDSAGHVLREVICQSGIATLAELHELRFESRGGDPALTIRKGTLSKVRLDSLSIVSQPTA